VTVFDIHVEGRVGALDLAVTFTSAAPLVVLTGPNGAGKTSLLQMILGVLAPRKGAVAFSGRRLFDHEAGLNVPVESRRIGFLPQRHALFPHLTVLENVAYGIDERARTARRAAAHATLRDLEIDHLAARRPKDLSGGESQRVALARALASRPEALLLDEPLAALDVAARRGMRTYLLEKLQHWKLPALVVTHDRDDALAFQAPIVVLEHGRCVQSGSLDELARHPATPFVREFVSGLV